LSVIKQSYVGASPRLFNATRLSGNVAFNTAATVNFANVNLPNHETSHGKFSADGLERVLRGPRPQRGGARRGSSARRARARRRRSAPARRSAELNDPGAHTYPSFLSPDGLRLYFFRPIPSAPFVATRASVGAAFGAPTAAPFANLGFVDHPWLTANELEMYFAIGGKLWWTSRPNPRRRSRRDRRSRAWSAAGIDLDCPVLSGDTLFYFRNGDIYAAKMVPEPGGVAVMLLTGAAAAAGLRLRRAKG
jgi:hypothetical protein